MRRPRPAKSRKDLPQRGSDRGGKSDGIGGFPFRVPGAQNIPMRFVDGGSLRFSRAYRGFPAIDRDAPGRVGLHGRESRVALPPRVRNVVNHHKALAGQADYPLDEKDRPSGSRREGTCHVHGGEGDHGYELGEVLLKIDRLILGIARIRQGDNVPRRGKRRREGASR